MDDGLRQQRRGGGTVAGNVIGLGCNLTDELRAHILKRILQLHFLGDGHAVVGDQRSAVLLAEYNVAALRSEGHFYGICQLVNAGLELLTGVFAEFDHFSHS